MVQRGERSARTADLLVELEGRRDLSYQIYSQIRAAITEGRLKSGGALPSLNWFAERLSVSTTTIAKAYERLREQGFVRSRVGVGYYVNDYIPPDPGRPPSSSPLRPRAVWDAVVEPPDLTIAAELYDFRLGVPDVRELPFTPWRRLIARQLWPNAMLAVPSVGVSGHHGLRRAIAQHLSFSREVRASADDVLLTAGAEQAIDMIGRVLIDPGDVVAVEDPGYLPVRQAMTALGAKVVGVPIDEEGIVIDELPRNVKLVYVRPPQQFPMGMEMSRQRRVALLDWADRSGAGIVEDDSDGEFGRGDVAPETLQSMDAAGRVLFVGTLSRAMQPVLRLGFLVAPATLHNALRKAKYMTDRGVDLPAQIAAEKFIDDGALARHISHQREMYAARHRLLNTALTEELGEYVDVLPSAAGAHITVLLKGGQDDEVVAREAMSLNVAIHHLSAFSMDRILPPGLIFGFEAISADRIRAGVRRIRKCFEALAHQ